MKLTKHAEVRKNQRGFSNFSLELIENFGEHRKAPGGVTRIFLGNKEYQKAVQELKKVIQLLDKAKGGSVIIDGNQIITVYK